MRLAPPAGRAYTSPMPDPVAIPIPTLRRLPEYLRVFRDRRDAGDSWLSSEAVGQILGFGAVQVRRDLAAAGASGSPKCGYPVSETVRRLEALPGIRGLSAAILVGSGRLGEAVLADPGMERHGLRIEEIFDLSPDRVDRVLDGRRVLPLSRLPETVRRTGCRLAVLAVDPDQAGAASLALARAGIAGILDLSGAASPFPKDLLVRRFCFASGLAALAGELDARERKKNLDGFPRQT